MADCRHDCDVALNSADKLIKDLKDEISVQKNIISDQQNNIIDLTLDNNKKTEQLSSVWSNPWFVGSLGFILGSTTVLLLRK